MPTTTWTTAALAEDYYFSGSGQLFYMAASKTGTAYPSVAHKVTAASMVFSSIDVWTNGNFSAVTTYGTGYTASACGAFGSSYTLNTPIQITVACNTGTYAAGGGYYPANGLGVYANTSAGFLIIKAGSTITFTVTWELLNSIYVKSNGVWVSATPYVKSGGVWTKGDAYIKSGGAWVLGK